VGLFPLVLINFKNNYGRKVKWFNGSKGYGFIEGSDGTDYFAHFQEIQVEGYKTLKEGADVSFEPGDGEKGPVAKNIVNA